VTADPALLNTVLRNLFDNVNKYAQPNSVIAIRVTSLAEGGSIVMANHCAAPPGQHLANLMEKNMRGDNSGKADGIGMGLYIVKKLIEDMGGTTSIRLDALDRFEITLQLPHRLLEKLQ